jgi:integrase
MTEPRKQVPRARKGEGHIGRFHNHPTCPPLGPDGKRPDHKCQGLYRTQVWVTTTTGKKVRKTVYGKTETAAVAAKKKLIAQEDRQEVVGSSTTVKEWFRTDAAELDPPRDNYWTEHRDTWKASTRKGYASKIEQYIIPLVGHHRLDRLTAGHLDKMFADMRRQGLAEGSLRQTFAILSRGLKIARRRGLVARNVCADIDPPTTKTNPRKPLTVRDAWKVLKFAGDNPRFWVSLMAGVRQGEALALRWSAVHLDAVDDEGNRSPFLVVRQAVYRETGVGMVFDTPKSRQSTDRVVPLVTPVAARLTVAKAKHLASGGSEEDLVFPNLRTGKPKDPRADWSEWTALLEGAGVRHTPLHAARNTTSQLLEDAGVPVRVVAEILGHAQVSMTHQYQSGNLRAKREAMKALDAYMTGQDPDAA